MAQLAAWAVAVALGYLAGRDLDPRPWVAVVIAACPAVVCAPALLAGLEGVARVRRWGRWADEEVRAAWGVDRPAAPAAERSGPVGGRFRA